jgi:hypothetical protein
MAKTPEGRRKQRQRHERAACVLRRRQQDNARRPTGKRKDARKIQVSVSDPESVVGLDKLKTYRPLYTVGMLCDRKSDLILAYQTYAAAGDSGTLGELLSQAMQTSGRALETVVGDAGFASLADAKNCDDVGTTLYARATNSFRTQAPPKTYPKEMFKQHPEQDVFVCPQGHELRPEQRFHATRGTGPAVTGIRYRCAAEVCQACPVKAACTSSPNGRTLKRMDGEEHLDALKERMKTEEAKTAMRERPATIERCFADARTHRRWTRFHGRGLPRVRTETGLVVLAHNLIAFDKLRASAHAGPENRE